MQPTALSLLPPILVLITAMITQRLSSSIILGLIVGGLIATKGSLYKTFGLISGHLADQVTDPDNLYLYIFLLCVGMLIAVINFTGAARAFALALRSKIQSKRQAEHTTFFISLILSIDDYLNCLTVGNVMQSLTDNLGIAREKLAYLIHTFASPLVILIPISTWAAFITSQIEQAGISTTEGNIPLSIDPFYAYLHSIPCIYYAIFTVLTALYIITRSISYGPMHTVESKMATHGSPELKHTAISAQASDLLIPLSTLVTLVFFGMLYTGDYALLGGSQTFIEAFQHNPHAFMVLGLASIATLILSIFLSMSKKQLSFDKAPEVLWNGFMLMWPAVLLVILASALGGLLRLDLQTGDYLASSLLHAIEITYLPITFYAVAVITSVLIGTAWGTIALLLPIGIPMAHTLALTTADDISMLTILIVTIGAILAGATYGDHTTPIAASSVMSSTSADCKTIDHIRTQLPYTFPPLIGAGSAFLTTGILLAHSWHTIVGASLSVGICVTFVLIELFHRFWK